MELKNFTEIKEVEEKLQLLLLNIVPTTFDTTDNKGNPTACDIYFVDEEFMKEYKTLESAARIILDIPTESKRSPLFNISHFVNKEGVVYRFNGFRSKIKYKLVTDKEKTFPRIKSQFNIWKNMRRKKLYIFINENIKNIIEEQKLTSELELEIEKKEKLVNLLHDNQEEFDILDTTFEREDKYPHIYCNYIDADGKKGSKNFYIRAGFPNICHFDSSLDKHSDLRPNAVAAKFIREGNNLFGDVYFKPESDTNPELLEQVHFLMGK